MADSSGPSEAGEPKISHDRLKFLRFQATKNGLTPEAYARLEREGRLNKIPHGPMVVITIWELQQFLNKYGD